MVDKTSLQSYMIDTEFTRKLSYGKYSRWAERITSAEFITIVEAISQLGKLFGHIVKRMKNYLIDSSITRMALARAQSRGWTLLSRFKPPVTWTGVCHQGGTRSFQAKVLLLRKSFVMSYRKMYILSGSLICQ